MTSLRVSALELPHRYGAPELALARLDRALTALRGEVDLVLLPECALTGYLSPEGDFDLSRFAEPLDGPTAARLSGLASAHRISLAATLIEREGANVYNTLALHDPSGALSARWRKRHPWYPERWATPGDTGTPVIEHRGLRLTACVCFDIHFIADDAPEALRAADVLLFPSAWVDDGLDDARSTILPGLARRFGLSIVNANWGRGPPATPGQGASRIVDSHGAQTLARRVGDVRSVGSSLHRRGAR